MKTYKTTAERRRRLLTDPTILGGCFLCLFFAWSMGDCRSTLAQAGASQGSAGLAEVAGGPAAPTWVFLGDSNTYSGGYVTLLDAWLRNGQSPIQPKILNLGMSSETASGLSEQDHPFKRPCVHERLDKVLTMTKPAVVFFCYGMNDGIYQPPNPANLAAYKEGIAKLVRAIKQTGARSICLTPPIFEPEPVKAKGNLGPSAAGRYAYFAPAANYDEVLEKQTEWLLENQFGADALIDIHQLLYSEKQQRMIDKPDFSYSNDGVHFGPEAHALVAEAILKSLGATQLLLDSYPSSEQIALANKKMTLLRDAYLSATGKNRPGLAAGFPVWYAEQLVSQLSPNP